MFAFFGGRNSIPGVSSDNQSPGGEIIAGAIQAGDSTATDVPMFHRIFGDLIVQSVPGTDTDGDDVLDVHHFVDLLADSFASALICVRSGLLNGHDATAPVVIIQDFLGASGPLLQCSSNHITQFQVDSDGVQIHGKIKTGASVTHTLGAYSGKAVPIYDESGTLLGYMPLYA